MFNTTEVYQQLDLLGLRHLRRVNYQLNPAELIEMAINDEEGVVAKGGAFVVRTGKHTGRAPDDRFIVKEPMTQHLIDWGDVNKPFSADCFGWIFQKMQRYLRSADVYVRDCYAGAHPEHQMKVRVVTETAWHNLFAYNMFRRAQSAPELDSFSPDYTVLHLPDFNADPENDGTHSEAFVLIHLTKRLVLIGGTHYAGGIKKAIFGVLNFLLPREGVLPMHCAANTDENGETALFFGLSGTGKTTLSADAQRTLIGDDEHGWGDDGVFNFEGGCYAKTINLSEEGEPEIYATTRRFGTVLENVMVDEHRVPDFTDATLTQNTRCSYPIYHIPNASDTGCGAQPRNVIFLTCDAFGVLPPVSKLTPAQAAYHFLNGYTAKVAGTEGGVTEPQATFSACFGAPFMPLPAVDYAAMLREKIDAQDVNVWLVNTGWTGGAYGMGHRIELTYTRAIINAILDGTLAQTPTQQEDFFGLYIPMTCPGVPETVLHPRETWADRAQYDETARELLGRFDTNYQRYADTEHTLAGAAD